MHLAGRRWRDAGTCHVADIHLVCVSYASRMHLVYISYTSRTQASCAGYEVDGSYAAVPVCGGVAPLMTQTSLGGGHVAVQQQHLAPPIPPPMQVVRSYFLLRLTDALE